MKVTDVRVRLFENKSLKGFADVTLDESLALTGIKIIDSSKGLFVGMPMKNTMIFFTRSQKSSEKP